MNKLSKQRRAQVIAALVEGNSIRATCRMTGAAKGTVTRLLESVGKACREYQDKTLVNLTCRSIQCDEIWSFCYAKQKNVPENKQGQYGYGDVWTWVAIDADTKLVPSWVVGLRNSEWAYGFMCDLKSRLSNKIQLTTDGLNVYLEAVERTFGSDIDYAMLVKLYGPTTSNVVRYSPPKFLGTQRGQIQGNPDKQSISTSYVERQNLTMRMSMRRFTRLTNGFSKKVQNLEHAVSLHFMHYNFCRVHKTLGVTPAMAAKVSRYIWKIEDIVNLLDSN